MTEIKLGDLVPADIPAGESSNGLAAGLAEGYQLRGVGLVPMRDVYPADQLTDFCGPEDTCWAAEVVSVPSE